MANKKYDVIIIGGGPGGITCGALLAKWGVKTLLIEQNERGVTCVRAKWRESGRLYVIWCGALAPNIAASIVQDRLDAWAEASRWTRQPVSILSTRR